MSRSRKVKKAARPTADHGPPVPTPLPLAPPTPPQGEATAVEVADPPAPPSWPDPDPPEPAVRSPRRRRLRILALAVLAPAAFILGMVVPLIALTHHEHDSQPQPAAITSSRPPSHAVSPSTTPSVRPQQDVVGSAGIGQTRPGILVRAQVDAQGNLEVVEQVRFGTPRSDVTLRVPSLRGATGEVAALHPRVNELQVSADGELASVPQDDRVVTTTSRLGLPRAAQTLVLRYRVDNASVRSLPGPPGRALLVLPPISTIPDAASLPVVVEVSGGTIRNLLCPALDRQHQLCGHSDGPTWHTDELESWRTAVLAQVDLPAPGA